MIRLCIIGCGAVVEGSHARVLPALADRVRVTACYDLDVARARAMARRLGAKRAARPDAIAADHGLWDAALVATPPADHAPLVRALISGGRHVLVEKPFVTHESDARELVTAAEDGRVRLLVGHFRRFYPALQAARAFVASGALGPIERIEVWEGGRWDWPARSSYAFTSPDGGVTLDTGSHALDTLLYTLGLDTSDDVRLDIEACAKTPATEPSQDATVRGRLSGGALAPTPLLVRVSRLGPLATAVKLHGADGRTLVIPASFAGMATLVTGGVPTAVSPPADATYRPPDATSAFYSEHLDFVRAIEEPTWSSVLDAGRFIGLTRVLEAITAAPVTA